MRSSPRGSLEWHVRQAPLSDEELFALRQAAWLKQGVVVIRPDDIRDEWTRQALVAEATKLYGRRPPALVRVPETTNT